MKIMLSTLACLCALPVLAFCSSSFAKADDVSSMDKLFVKKAAIGGLFEVQSGKLAQSTADSQDVKDFGGKMVEDHGKANDELKGIATSLGLEVPSQLDAKHQKLVDALSAKTGKSFDKLYLADLTKAHNLDDALFLKEAGSGTNQQLKDFADKTDKVIKMHIQMLDDIKSKTK